LLLLDLGSEIWDPGEIKVSIRDIHPGYAKLPLNKDFLLYSVTVYSYETTVFSGKDPHNESATRPRFSRYPQISDLNDGILEKELEGLRVSRLNKVSVVFQHQLHL
jgi:hypothetical protein